MKIDTFLDVDVVALETGDEVSMLLELTAPAAPGAHQRPPATLVVVLDRSGSMAGRRLWVAQQALCALVDRLDPTDRFGLVAFDSTASVVVAAGPVRDKDRVKDAVLSVHAGSTTDLSAGYLLGLQEAGRVGGDSGRLLIVSDGHANVGITDPDRLAAVAQQAAGTGVVTTTLGLGLGYDERLLGAIARSGTGGELFAEEPDEAAAAITAEVDGLLEQSVTAASLLVRPSSDVTGVRVVNDLPTHAVDDGVLVELGAFVSGEARKVVLTFDVPAMSALGPSRVATVELRYVALPGLVQETVTLPVMVNVVPGSEAAERIADPVVRTELVYQRTQAAKRAASRRLLDGDAAGAADALRSALGDLTDGMAGAPPVYAADLAEEAVMLTALIDETTYGSSSRASKRMTSDAAHKSRTRGRTGPQPSSRPTGTS